MIPYNEINEVNNMRIINYGHACFKIIDDDISIILDPYQDQSVPGLTLPDGLEADYVFCSHDHYDHNAFNKVKLTNCKPQIYMKEIVLNHDPNEGRLRGKSIARIFYFSDYSICHLGDIGDVEQALEIEELKNIDVVLCPINGFYTIGALDALKLQKVLNWKLLIPMHYFKKEDGSGYPDGNQIDIFKNKIDKYFSADTNEIEINDKLFSYRYLIFE